MAIASVIVFRRTLPSDDYNTLASLERSSVAQHTVDLRSNLDETIITIRTKITMGTQ